jgi:hypothetical protein
MRAGFTGFVAALILVCISTVALANAPRRLTEAQATHAITTYEHSYWEGFTTSKIPITISQCKRYDDTHISCLARTIVEEFWAFSRDWVILSPNGHILVHSGGLQMWPFRSSAEALAMAHR